jgi:hypothetical protein
MHQTDASGEPPFAAGTAVPRSARYAAIHEGHHLPFQMMHLFGGELFPACPQCGDAVTYVEVIRARRRERTFGTRSITGLRAI